MVPSDNTRYWRLRWVAHFSRNSGQFSHFHCNTYRVITRVLWKLFKPCMGSQGHPSCTITGKNWLRRAGPLRTLVRGPHRTYMHWNSPVPTNRTWISKCVSVCMRVWLFPVANCKRSQLFCLMFRRNFKRPMIMISQLACDKLGFQAQFARIRGFRCTNLAG